MAYVLVISLALGAVGLVVCYMVDMVKLLLDPEKTNDFALTWLLFWMIDEE